MPAPLTTSMHLAPPSSHQMGMGASPQLHTQDRNSMYAPGSTKSVSSISPPAARVDIGAEALKAFYTGGSNRGRDISELERFVREKEEMNLPPSPSTNQGKPRKSVAAAAPAAIKPKEDPPLRQQNEVDLSRAIYQPLSSEPSRGFPNTQESRAYGGSPERKSTVLVKSTSYSAVQQPSLVQKMTDFDRDKVHQERQWLLQRLGELETIERIHDSLLQNQHAASAQPVQPPQSRPSRSNSFHGIHSATQYEQSRGKPFSTPTPAAREPPLREPVTKDSAPAFNIPLATQAPPPPVPSQSSIASMYPSFFQTASSPAPAQEKLVTAQGSGYSFYGAFSSNSNATQGGHMSQRRPSASANSSKLEATAKKASPSPTANHYQSNMRLNLGTSASVTASADARGGSNSDYRSGTHTSQSSSASPAINVPLTFNNLSTQQQQQFSSQPHQHPATLLASTVSSWGGRTVASHTPPPGTLNCWLRQLKESMDVINNQLTKRGASATPDSKPPPPSYDRPREPLLSISGQPHVSKKADPLSPDKAAQPHSKRYSQPPPVDALLPPPVSSHAPKAPPTLTSPVSPQPLLRPPSTTSSYEEYSIPELCLTNKAPTVSSVSSIATMGEFAQQKQETAPFTAPFKNIGSPCTKVQSGASPTNSMMIPIASVPQFKCDFFTPRPGSRKEDSGMNTPVDDIAQAAEDP